MSFDINDYPYDIGDYELTDEEISELFVHDIMTRLKPTADTWVTAKGERIPVEYMTDLHLLNTVRMIKRRGAETLPTYPTLLAEVTKRNLEIGELYGRNR